MRIALDTTRINIPDGGGRYTNEILKYLCKLHPNDSFFAIGPKPGYEHKYNNLKLIQYRTVDGIPSRLAYTIGISKILKRYKIDVFHNITNYGIYNSSCPTVTTVHDLLTYKFPNLRSKRIQWYLYKFYLPYLLKKSTKIIAVSNNTKNDLKELYGINNVDVIYEGFDEKIFNENVDNDENILAKYRIKSDYLLFVGYLTPKKNMDTILKSLDYMRRELNFTIHFVIVGQRGPGAEDIFSLIDTMKFNNQISELGFVSDDELGAIYRNAKVFVFPSIYEGFGLPVLESMACSTPVIASNAGSLPEIVGNDEFLCPPNSVETWAYKIYKLFNDKSYYKSASNFCINRSKEFSWVKCAKDIMKIYKEILK